MKTLLIKNKDSYKEVPLDTKVMLDVNWNLTYDTKATAHICNHSSKETTLNSDTPLYSYKYIDYEDVTIGICEEETRKYRKASQNRTIIGTSTRADIKLLCSDTVECIVEANTVRVIKGDMYLNGVYCKEGSHAINAGDCLLIELLQITITELYLEITGNANLYEERIDRFPLQGIPFPDFPIYKRSPRIIKKAPSDKLTILGPPSMEDKKKGQLLKTLIPPLVMLIVTIGVNFVNPRGLYVLIGMVSTLSTMIFTLTGYFQDKKASKKKEKERQENYEKYLLKQRKKINELAVQQKDALNYNYPAPAAICQLVLSYSSRIYEHSAIDDDFLTYSIGTALTPSSYKLETPVNELGRDKDELAIEVQELVKEFTSLEELPVSVDLKNAHVGLVGTKKNIHNQLMSILLQITFFQSYHDVEIICLLTEESSSNFQWLRWFPHCKLRAINVTSIIDSGSISEQVLGNLTQVLKQRKTKFEEQKRTDKFFPHYLFIVEDPKLLINHSIMEILQSENDKLGFSIIYTTDMITNLPEYIKTVIELETPSRGKLVLNEGVWVEKKITLYNSDKLPLEEVSRKLTGLKHIQGISTQIPESITFFDLFGVKHPQELNIVEKWKQHLAYKSLSVPLGVRAKDDIVELNLHEKAHGPHGLVAGTTGSGKSEILQSYILSLAINFHPYEVGFLLIDYKGGGMSSLFKKLPHLLGTITNLDGSESMRALASIKSELSRRQILFNEYKVNHINQYSKLFIKGIAKEPVPHLFLISDEFAELKKEQPEFMHELVSAARIGRSLGIHLILATQKPSGVVDDQIWSNSKFKLALKVQNEADSKEILKTPDAANIILPGRSYLQVGNNEIYELFQSAWSGASYQKGQTSNTADDRIYVINKLGQGVLLGNNFDEELEENSSTQLDVTVEHIFEVYKAINNAPVPKPWFPPLNNSLITPYVNTIIDVNVITQLDLTVVLGIGDFPEKQSQEEIIIDVVLQGNLAIFGSSGFGKSTTLMTIAMSLAVKNAPTLLQYYILDFGNASLSQLQRLPHTADYFTFEEEKKIEKLIKKLSNEMLSRKNKFSAVNALNFTMYNEVISEKLPAIIIMLDNYDAVKEIGYDFEDFLTKLTRDGAGLGIYVIATASRTSAIKYVVQNNFKQRISHQIIEKIDMVSAVGKSNYTLNDIPGRALIKMDEVSVMQVYTIAATNNITEYAKNTGQKIAEIADKYTGKALEGIRMLPETLTFEMLKRFSDDPTKKEAPSLVAIGLDNEEVEVQYINLLNAINLIIGPIESGKTNILKIIINQLNHIEAMIIIDSNDLMLNKYQTEENVSYYHSAQDVNLFLTETNNVVEKRRHEFSEANLSSGENLLPRQYYSSLPQILIIIDDIDTYIEWLKSKNGSEMDYERLMKSCIEVGIHFVATTQSTKLKGFDSISKLFKEAIGGILLGIPGEQTILPVPHIRNYKSQIDQGFLYKKGELTQIQVPHIKEE